MRAGKPCPNKAYLARLCQVKGKMEDVKRVRVNSARAWLLAARPKTLSAACVPVIIGLALAFSDIGGGDFLVVPAVLCLLFAVTMQIDANYVNDYFDYINGNDNEERLGPRRACAMGWVSPGAMRRAIGLTTVLACLFGLPLIIFGGVEMVLIGALCVAFCFLYSTHLSRMGLGDVLVIVFFGIVPVTVVYYIEAHAVTPAAVMTALACGMVIDTLLLVNNYRDADNDRKAGKRTLIVKIGTRAGASLYLAAGIVACAICLAVFAMEGHWTAALLPLAYLMMHIASYREMVSIGRGKALNAVLGHTARNIMLFGIMLAAGLVI